MNLLLINWATFGLVVGLVAIIAVVFAVLIVLVSKLCAVKEDEKAVAIQENLAGANCGGCGYAGCSDFAKALSEGRAEISACGPTPSENKRKIAEIMGVPFSDSEQVFAVVKCAGGVNAKDKFEYIGNRGCKAEFTYMGGRKQCIYGCIGGGSCVDLCPYGAIKIKDGVSVVDKRLCEACGLCVKNCSKKIIELIPKSASVYVACSSKCKGKDVINACSVGCIGCGLCAKNCPENAITMVDNLPVIDYSKCTGCKTCVGKCPKKCIKEI
jgi:Na+-translocating ferredoxin:NAD+ oxidoreductase RNF subunit RnfB